MRFCLFGGRRAAYIGRTMTRFAPIFTAMTLSLLLVLGAQRQAMTHAGGDVTEMVLCTGSGATTVWIGRDGEPVAPPHDCPDCTLCLPHGLLPEIAVPASAIGSQGQPILRAAQLDLSRPASRPFARGPPLPVWSKITVQTDKTDS